MFKLVELTICLGYAYSCGVPAVQPITSMVVGDINARAHSWPWQISLQYQRTSSAWGHTCDGTLISDTMVLTAAHCISSSRDYRVYLGKQSLQTEDEACSIAITPEKIIVHENWNSIINLNNIALIKLSQPVQLSDTIQPACLPSNGDLLASNGPCFVTGWGPMYNNGTIADNLQQALLPLVDYVTCSQSELWQITNTMVCAGGDSIVSGFTGDSGSPLKCQAVDGSWEVHGLGTSGSGESRNNKRMPSVYTSVSAYINWIKNTSN